MPAKWFECCGKRFTIDEALEHVEHRTNSCHWTYEILAAMLAAQAAHPSSRDGSRISTTVLTNKCLRRLAFERNHEYTVAPDDLYPMFRGTQFHGFLEEHAHPASYGEARFYVSDLATLIPSVGEALPDDDRSLSGSPDLIDPGAGVQYDYKRTKEVPRWQHVWPDHVEQLNINRWLVDHADYVEVERPPLGAPRHGADVYEVVSETGATRYRYYRLNDDGTTKDVWRHFAPVDWQELTIVYVDDKGPKPITVTESIDVPAKKGGTKRARVPVVWDDDKVEALIAKRYPLARKALNEGLAPIPSGWEHQSHALCVRCPFRRTCAEYEKDGR